MYKRQIRLKWTLKNVCVLSVDLRFKKNRLNQQEEYAVIGVGTVSDYDEIEDLEYRQSRKVKPITLMCFQQTIYGKVKEGTIYSFAGKVGFGYGNTYFTIEECFLPGGFPLAEAEDEDNEEGECPPPRENQAFVSIDKECESEFEFLSRPPNPQRHCLPIL